MADILGVHFIPTVAGAVLVFDDASVEPQVEKDERKPANSLVPVEHYTGKRMKITFKGPLEGQALPGAGTAVTLAVAVPSGFDATTLPKDVQDVINGVYSGWCVQEPKFSFKQGIAEYDGLDIMSNCVTTLT